MAGTNRVEILVVEDSPTQAEQLKYILEKRGFKVSIASNGKEALASLRSHKPDIVITDIVMPEMNGYELCRQTRKDLDLHDMPVVLVTALTDPTEVVKGLEAGANTFITKPYDEKYLISRIEYLMANKSLRKDQKDEAGINVFFSGEKCYITAERLQILDFLLSTYENAYLHNRELLAAQAELTKLNERLEETVEELEKARLEAENERRRLEAAMEARKLMEEELRRSRDQLEMRVQERTAELQDGLREARGGNKGEAAGRTAASPGPENGGGRHPRGRHSPRFQQHPRGDTGQCRDRHGRRCRRRARRGTTWGGY